MISGAKHPNQDVGVYCSRNHLIVINLSIVPDCHRIPRASSGASIHYDLGRWCVIANETQRKIANI